MHYKFMELDGKVHGFTPMQAAFPIIKTLGAIKDYHGHFFDSGIFPDLIFNFEEMDPGSVAHEKMRQELATWYNNRRRSFAITTTKMKVEKLNVQRGSPGCLELALLFLVTAQLDEGVSHG